MGLLSVFQVEQMDPQGDRYLLEIYLQLYKECRRKYIEFLKGVIYLHGQRIREAYHISIHLERGKNVRNLNSNFTRRLYIIFILYKSLKSRLCIHLYEG